MLSNIENIEKLLKKYNFDYIYINQKDISKIPWEYIPEEIFYDFKGPANYLGSIKIDDKLIEVYWNPTVDIGYAELRYKNLKKERKIKIEDLLNKKES